MLHLTIYDKNLKKIDYKRYRTIKSIFFKFISFWVDIFLSHDAYTRLLFIFKVFLCKNVKLVLT